MGVGVGGGGCGGEGDVARALLLHLDVGHKPGEVFRGRVDCLEVEEIEEEGAVVEDEFSNRALDEFELHVGELGNTLDGVYAVEVGVDALER